MDGESERMSTATLLWTEYPYRAGFCITDDTDAATLEQTRAVYDFLMEQEIRTTKTVWPFHPTEPCGIPATPDSTLRGITLQDAGYLSYCSMLARNGYDICLHGASAGNNSRQATLDALDFAEQHFGPSDTFICHSKNAENLYWESEVTRLFPFRQLIGSIQKHSCSGEIEDSRYFWGDVCGKRVQFVRLLRTRCTNTLKRNPSMPYHDPRKPYVNYWFSATKRSIHDCATPAALDRLKRENGLTILYQYLHRYADPLTLDLDAKFTEAVRNLASDSLLHVHTASHHLRRLRSIRNIVVVQSGGAYWVLNAGSSAIKQLQFTITNPLAVTFDEKQGLVRGDTLVIDEIPAGSAIRFETTTPISFRKCAFVKLLPGRSAQITVPAGTVMLTIEPPAPGITASTHPNLLFAIEPDADGFKKTSTIPLREEYRMLMDQMRIVLREIVFKGRSLDSNTYLDTSKSIPLENHDTW